MANDEEKSTKQAISAFYTKAFPNENTHKSTLRKLIMPKYFVDKI